MVEIIIRKDYNEMNHFEIMESVGQTNIFDYIEGVAPSTKRNNAFEVGDSVKLHFYQDEYDFIIECHPHLLEAGEVIGKHLDFHRVQIGGAVVDVPGDKLVFIENQ